MGGPMVAAKRSFNYQKPEDWLEAPHPELGVVPREALFEVKGDGGQTAEVSVTKFGGQAGGVMPNVALWARQDRRSGSRPRPVRQVPEGCRRRK